MELVIDRQPDLRILNWTSDGFEHYMEQIAGIKDYNSTYFDFRIQPNQLYSGDTIGFTGWWKTMPKLVIRHLLDLNCMT